MPRKNIAVALQLLAFLPGLATLAPSHTGVQKVGCQTNESVRLLLPSYGLTENDLVQSLAQELDEVPKGDGKRAAKPLPSE